MLAVSPFPPCPLAGDAAPIPCGVRRCRPSRGMVWMCASSSPALDGAARQGGSVQSCERQRGVGWSWSRCLVPHAPTCQQGHGCHRTPSSLPSPEQGPPCFLGVVFLPTPASRRAGSHKGRTCRLSDGSSLSWHCGWRRRGRSTVVLGTGKCRRWGGGSLQPGFLSSTADTSQIKVSPRGAAAAAGALGSTEHGTRDAGGLPAPGLAACAAHHGPAEPPQPHGGP